MGLTFLLTKEQLGILEGAEEQNLNYARNHMTDEELGEYLEKELAIVKNIEQKIILILLNNKKF